MKKYLRLILEILLGICLVAASTLAYLNYSAKKHLVAEVGELTEQLGEAKEALEKAHETEPSADEHAADAPAARAEPARAHRTTGKIDDVGQHQSE